MVPLYQGVICLEQPPIMVPYKENMVQMNCFMQSSVFIADSYLCPTGGFDSRLWDMYFNFMFNKWNLKIVSLIYFMVSEINIFTKFLDNMLYFNY